MNHSSGSDAAPAGFAGHMRRALEAAREAGARGDVPVGAVIVAPSGAVIAVEGNRMTSDCDPTAHAEMRVIQSACRMLGRQRLEGLDIWTTLEPCAMCAAAISFARLRRLYFGAADPKFGAVSFGPRFFQQPTCHHAPEVYDGISEQECAAELRRFFEARR